MMVLDIVIDGKTQIVHLLCIERMGGINDVSVVTGLHFHEDRSVSVLGNYINISMAGMPVTC